MPPKAKTDDAPPSVGSGVSGKFVIIAILFVAFWAAGISWWFRYNATHRTAKFWGGENAALIRDAPKVTLFEQPMVATDSVRSDPAGIPAAIQAHIAKSAIDISQARGLLHLRNALLEDRNFDWSSPDAPALNPAEDLGHWWLKFHDPASGKEAYIWFTKDCRQGKRHTLLPDGKYVATVFSAEPMAKGLREMFAEFAAAPANQPAEPAR